MKIYSFILSIAALIFCSQAKAGFRADSLPQNDSLIIKLKSVRLSNYKAGPVDSLIAHLPAGIIDYKIGASHNLKVADVLFIHYRNDVTVAVFVKSFTHMDPNVVNSANPTQNWIVSAFRQENVAYSIIYNGTTCINGCENQTR